MSARFEFGEDICRIFGEDPNKVQSITVRVEAGGMVAVAVERAATQEELNQVLQSFRVYTITPLDEDG